MSGIRSVGYGLLCLGIASGVHAEEHIDVYAPMRSPVIDGQTEAEESADHIAGNVSVTDSASWDDRHATNIKAVTDYIPGVVSQPRNGAESDRLSVRGSGLANVFQGRGLLVLQDGIPVNMADGEFEFPLLDPWLTRYAEVFPGADALEYGASTLGGAIDFVTPHGSDINGEELRFEGGSFGTLHVQALTGRTWDGGDLFASADGFEQDGFRDHNEQHTSRLNANLGWAVDDTLSSRAYVSHIHSDAQIPGAISLAQIGADPTAANPNNRNGNYQRNLDITRVADKLAWQEGSDRIDATAFYSYRELDNPVTTYEIQRNHDVGLRLKFTHSFGLSEWLAGVNSYYGNADETRYTNVGGTPGAHILDRNLYAMTNEAYGQLEQHLAGRLFGIVGIQGAYDTRDIHQGFPTADSLNTYYAGFSPRVGLRYDLAAQTQLFANLSRSFEPPSWGELSGGNSPGFNALKAQKATTAEIGTRARWLGFHWQAAYYHGWVRNEFVNYLFADGSTNTINAARTKRDGVELEIDGDLFHALFNGSDAVNLRSAYTFSRFTLDHDPLYGDNTLPGVPRHFLRTELIYRHPSGISIGPNMEWSPARQPVDLTNSLSADGYVIMGARGAWKSADERVSFYMEASNLLDKHYIATTNVIPDANGQDGRYFYPGEGRAFYFGMKWNI